MYLACRNGKVLLALHSVRNRKTQRMRVKVVLGVKWPSRVSAALQLRKCVGFSDMLSTSLLPRLNAFSCQDAILQAKSTSSTSLATARHYSLKLMIEIENECKWFITVITDTV